MRPWQIASFTFFLYILLVVVATGRTGPSAARGALAGVGAGLFVVLASIIFNDSWLLQNWLLPPMGLLIAYWASGLLFVAPNARQERALMWLDDRLAIRDIARRTPRIVADVLEAAYVGVYPLVLLGLVVHLTWSAQPDASRFWAVVLITDFICFGGLPWVQTRPPRALEPEEPWSSSLRRFNLRLLGATSIQVNTFPSGHAAEAVAAALLTLDAPWPVALFMWTAALAVSAGAVLGRYHYAADALTGWLVAAMVFVASTNLG
jgi:membrane-associated phospholipid phosphatase